MHQDGTGNFKEICLMIWNEVMLGITFATHDPMICVKKGLKSCSLKGIILWGLLNFSFTCLGCVLGPWGKRSTDNTTAVNLFYIMLSLNIHLWACGVVASYVPQLSYCKNLHIVETWNGVLLIAFGRWGLGIADCWQSSMVRTNWRWWWRGRVGWKHRFVIFSCIFLLFCLLFA